MSINQRFNQRLTDKSGKSDRNGSGGLLQNRRKLRTQIAGIPASCSNIGPIAFETADSKSFFFIQRFLDRQVFHPEFGKRVPRKTEMPANIADGLSPVEHCDNGLPIFNQYVQFGITPVTTTQDHPLGTPQRQRLARPHRNKIALDLRDESESKTQHLAVDRIVERIALLGRLKVDSPFQAFAHNRHNVRKRSAQARNLRNDQRSVFLKTAQQAAELAVSLALLTADDFRHPMVHDEIPAFGETPDLILLVGKMLFSRADA